MTENKRRKVLVVGAGFTGATIARTLAEYGNIEVTLIDKREHIAGNAYDFVNEHGIRVHKYGPHIFHTNNAKIVDWLSRFTTWVPYRHKVLALLSDGNYVTIPPNQRTKETIGAENIIDILFRPYTKKMWGKDLEELDPSIINRIPIRDDDNEEYFPNDKFQLMPVSGYTELIRKILQHPQIKINLSQEFNKNMEANFDFIFNSMPIDEYFEYQFGELPYRSIKFHTVSLPLPSVLPVPTINFTHHGSHTRVTEWQKYPNHGNNKTHTTLTFEEPCDYRDNNNERYYPVKDINRENASVYRKYAELTPDNMRFVGRCGKYVYIDMHQAVSMALQEATRYISEMNKIR